MDVGYYTEVKKVVEGWAGISVQPRVWTTISTVKDLPSGPTILNGQMYGTLPERRPKEIYTRWLRVGPSPDDPTQREGHPVGVRAAWAGMTTSLESVSKADQPYQLQMWHDGGAAIRMTAVITKALNPAAYVTGWDGG